MLNSMYTQTIGVLVNDMKYYMQGLSILRFSTFSYETFASFFFPSDIFDLTMLIKLHSIKIKCDAIPYYNQ